MLHEYCTCVSLKLEWSLTLLQLVMVCSVVVVGQDKLAMMCGDGSNKIVGRESFKVSI